MMEFLFSQLSNLCVLLMSALLYSASGSRAVHHNEYHRFQLPLGRIINGKPAIHGGDSGFPYLITLQALVGEDDYSYYYQHACGGVILDNRTIITAAHCFKNHPNPLCWVDKSKNCYRIVAGKHDMSQEFPEKEQIFSVSSEAITIHEDYDDFHYDNDIAVIHLDQPLVFNHYVKSIPLIDDSVVYKNTGVIAGWGQNMEGEPIHILRETNVTIFSDDHCTNQWGDDYHSDVMFCAGNDEVSKINGRSGDACFGDSGGPLVVQEEGNPSKKYIIGLISWGFECGYKEYPGLYTRVQAFLNWIREQQEQAASAWIKKRRHLRLKLRRMNSRSRVNTLRSD